MKPRKISIPNQADRSFSVRKDTIANVNNSWHHHKEIELICFHKGSGTQFIGDHIQRFEAGDVVLIGTDLPHYWKYDQHEIEDPGAAYSTVIHFMDNFMGEKFLLLPEVSSIKFLLDKARNGILISGKRAAIIQKKIECVYQLDGMQKIIALLDCLITFASFKKLPCLSSLGFKYDRRLSKKERLNKIYDFVLRNFKHKISLEEVAAMVDLTPHSFCRYFKNHTGKTFSLFLTEVRIGYARKLMLEKEMGIKEVCYESGFNNVTCFHKQFKSITNKTPKEYVNIHFST
ncbi:AraC family transcriptional regulator [Pedobacter foliorum]|uniref:AraC family transcriptional regulator n=1 Tax=Pedobacter foliorum TaxID=2739058 RepID=UPI001567B357|nr:AraC family transcriptional regulator [Pedobacter foliorum]NRF37805.1 helix-turn-helix transcriptional regulator [Pedobacter foliorum]